MTKQLISWFALALLLGLLAACGGGGGGKEDTYVPPDVTEVQPDTPDVPDVTEVDTCTPDCAGKTCGDDGCGGSCGSCTDDQTCDAGTCVPKGCEVDADCEGKCTSLGTCDQCTCSNTKCVKARIDGCCEDDTDCDDGQACDTAANQCYDICTKDADCTGQCGTLDTCETCECGGVGGDQCVKGTLAACCKDDTDCDADETCNDTTHKCEPKPVACADQPADYCASNNKCGTLSYCQDCVCNAGANVCEKVAVDAPVCCTSADQCNDDNEATLDECPDLGGPCIYKPNPAICPSGVDKIYFQADFDMGSMAQFDLFYDNDETDSVTWQLDAYDAHSGAYSMYFGDPRCHTYYNGQLSDDCLPLDPAEMDATGVEARVQTDYIQLGDSESACVYALTFWAKFEGEPTWAGYEANTFDQLKIYVKDGSTKTQIFASAVATDANTTEGDWKLFASDLTPFWGKNIRLIFDFDTVDYSKNFYFGALVDDIVVRSVPGASQCGSGLNCTSDGKVCTSDACTLFSNVGGGSGLCAYFKDANCEDCSGGADSECTSGGSCQVGDCVSKVCEYNLDVPCCQAELAGPISSWDFDAATLGNWKVTGATSTAATWRAVSGKGVDGSGAVYFGDPNHACTTNPSALCPSYDTGEPVKASLESETFILQDTPAYLLFAFDLWLSTEWDGTTLVDFGKVTPPELKKADRLTLYVKTGPVLNEVWSSEMIAGSTYVLDAEGLLGHEFRRIGVDISQFRGKAVSFVFAFDSDNALYNDHEGAYVDNVAVLRACAEPCSTDDDCFDGKPCTEEACAGGICQYDITGQCCAVTADCDDGDECTIDTCQVGLCKHGYSAAADCCTPGPVGGTAHDFESDSLDGFTVDVDPSSSATWQIAVDPASGSKALWFGDAATGTYENLDDAGESAQAVGTVSLPMFKVPAGGVPVLEFDLTLQTEWTDAPDLWEIPAADSAFDQLSVLANGVEIWNSFVYEVAGGGVAGQHVQASLADFHGANLTLSFRFDSLEGTDNAHAGAFIDNVHVTWVCVDYECFSSFECDDASDAGDVCTRDRCQDSQCVFEPTAVQGCCYPLDQAVVDFETGAADLDLVGASGAVKWQAVDNGRAHAGTGSLYFGDVATKTYDNPGQPVSGEVQWQISVPPEPGYVVEWWQWLDLDAQDISVPVSDRFTVRVWNPGAGGAGTYDTIFDNKPSYGLYKQWARRSISLDSYLGNPVWLLFTFESGDAQKNLGEGIYLDDLRVYKSCQ
jgi:hypothetical protein